MELTVDNIARILKDHDADRMECMDHDGFCCPTCDAHDFDNYFKHQAEALLKEMGSHYLPDPTVLRCKCGHIPNAGLGQSESRAMDRHLIEMAQREANRVEE